MQDQLGKIYELEMNLNDKFEKVSIILFQKLKTFLEHAYV